MLHYLLPDLSSLVLLIFTCLLAFGLIYILSEYAVSKTETQDQLLTMDAPARAVIPSSGVLWKKQEFLDFWCDHEGISLVQYKGSSLKSWQVRDLVYEGWHMPENIPHGDCVPKLRQVNHPCNAQIVVHFVTESTHASKRSSWSKVGSDAQKERVENEPTMMLDLKGLDEYHIEHTILHEFGHALGLAHENQHSDYLNVMEKFFVDEAKLMKCVGMKSIPKFQKQYRKLSNKTLMKGNYDEKSIMHYPTCLEMLKEEFRHFNSPEAVDKGEYFLKSDSVKRELTDKEKKMFKSFLWHIDHVTNEPSFEDKQFLANAYHKERMKSDPKYYSINQSEPSAEFQAESTTQCHVSADEIFSAYKRELRNIYCGMGEEDDPDSFLGIANNADYIDLALVNKEKKVDKTESFLKSTLRGGVDGIVASKSPIPMEDVLNADLRFVLVEGRPGIGKSVFSQELCKKWDSFDSLRRYKIVLHLQLRDKEVQECTSLCEFFTLYSKNEGLCKHVADEVSKIEGEGVLFVLDGFDELPTSVLEDRTSWLMGIISGKRKDPKKLDPCLPKATRLVTSRPSALHNDKYFPNKRRHIEILGFTNDCKKKYMKSVFTSESDHELLEHFNVFVQSKPVINALLYIPLNCAIVAKVYRQLEEYAESLPETMTEFYNIVIPALIRLDKIKSGEWEVRTPVPSLENLVKKDQDLKRICKLAHVGLFNENAELEFTDEEDMYKVHGKLEFSQSSGKEISCLGLMKKTAKNYVHKGLVLSYSFLHLSIQEFLAAWYVSLDEDLVDASLAIAFPHEVIVILPDGVNVRPHLYNFVCYLAGLIRSSRKFPFNSKTCTIFLNCCYEAQDSRVALHSIPIIIDLNTPMDMYVFGYGLVHIASVRWDVSVNTPFDMLVSSLDKYYSHDKGIQGSVLAFKISRESVSTLHLLLPNYVHVLHSIHTLSLSVFKDFVKHDYLEYQALRSCQCLRSLSIVFDYISCQGAQKLAKAISYCPNLGVVNLNYTTSSEVVRSLSELPELDQLLTAVLSRPTTVQTLNLSGILFRVSRDCILTTTNTMLVELEYPHLPANHSRYSLAWRTGNSLTYNFISIVEVRNLNWLRDLCLISNVSPSVKFMLRVHHHIPPQSLCNALGIINKFSDSTMKMELDADFSCLEPCDIKHLSRALCRDPAIPQRTLQKSRSLSDLPLADDTQSELLKSHFDQLQSHFDQLLEPKGQNLSFTKHHHSCPDLLELQSLRLLHEPLRRRLYEKKDTGFYYHAIPEWLCPDVEPLLSWYFVHNYCSML